MQWIKRNSASVPDLVDSEQFRAFAEQRGVAPSVLNHSTDDTPCVVSFADAEIRKAEVEEVPDTISATLKFCISDEKVDRHGGIVFANGWDFSNWVVNPVVQFAHDYNMLPVATGVGRGKSKPEPVWVQGKRVFSIAGFPVRDLYEFGYTVGQLCLNGFLRTASVGFRPLEWKRADDTDARPWGIDHLKSELLEWSVVPIPANPRALIQAKSIGIDIMPLHRWSEQVLDLSAIPATLGIDRETLESAYRVSDPAQKTIITLTGETPSEQPAETSVEADELTLDDFNAGDLFVSQCRSYMVELIDERGSWGPVVSHAASACLRFKSMLDAHLHELFGCTVQMLEAGASEQDVINHAVAAIDRFPLTCETKADLVAALNARFAPITFERCEAEMDVVLNQDGAVVMVLSQHVEPYGVAAIQKDWDPDAETEGIELSEDITLAHHHRDGGAVNHAAVCRALANLCGLVSYDSTVRQAATQHLLAHLRDDFPESGCNIEQRHLDTEVLLNLPDVFCYDADACQIVVLTEAERELHPLRAALCESVDLMREHERLAVRLGEKGHNAFKRCLDDLERLAYGVDHEDGSDMKLLDIDPEIVDIMDAGEEAVQHISLEIDLDHLGQHSGDAKHFDLDGMDREEIGSAIRKATELAIANRTGRVVDPE